MRWPVIFFCVQFLASAIDAAPTVEVTNVRRVFHNGEHNAFTDLVIFNNVYYLTFRSCPDGHGVSPNASVIILSSHDLKDWQPVHRFNVPKRDTRDPHFLVFKNQLFVYTGTWYSGNAPMNHDELELNLHLGYGVSTKDGADWSEPFELAGTFGHYVWRAATFDDKAYLCGRRKVGFEVGPRGEPNTVESLMLESTDGKIWRQRATFQAVDGDETAFLFQSDGRILGVGRRRGSAQLLRSEPPYEKWERTSLERFIGGPLLAKWGNDWLIGGRQHTDTGPVTSLYWLVDDKLEEFATLPSGGDTSYPGFIALSPTKAVVSWYSSHEKNAEGATVTSIYMANLSRTSQ